MWLLDVSHTCHTRAQTGVQRVVRQLYRALGVRARAITFDPYLASWRELRGWERRNLTSPSPGTNRGVSWPVTAKARGTMERWLKRSSSYGSRPTDAAGTLVPEIFSPTVASQVTALPRPIVAIFHDAIALKLPELTPAKTVARFPAYLEELRRFDGIAAVSEDSARTLGDYWRWLGARPTPPIRVIPLAVDTRRFGQSEPPFASSGSSVPVVLCVGSIEGRKNHLALLEACEQLWAKGARFELRLVGMARPETAGAALERIAELHAAGRAIRHDRDADDVALANAYEGATFTVYPSLMEGFGLPVLESVAHGKPCVCAGYGALGEAARGGGCLTLETVDATTLAMTIERLLSDSVLRERLCSEARHRKVRTWSEYADALVAFVTELRRR